MDIFVGSSIMLSGLMYYSKSLFFSTFVFLQNLNLGIGNFHFIFSKVSRISLSEVGIVNNFKMSSIT